MAAGRWITATVAINGTTSSEIDLGADFKYCLVIVAGTRDSASIALNVSNDNTTFYAMQAFDADAAGSFALATSAATTAQAAVFPCGSQYVKVVLGASQTTAAVTVYVRGLD